MRSTYTYSRPVLNAYLVREKDRRRLYELGLVLLAFLPVALGLIGYVWVHLELLQSGYRVNELEIELGELERHRSQLEVEAEHQAGPRQIEERAVAELGMQHRSLEQMIFPESPQ